MRTKSRTYTMAVGLAALLAMGCPDGDKPDPALEICCEATGTAYPVNRQTLVHNPLTITVHQLDPANLLNPKDLADTGTPVTDPVFADDETDDRYDIELPLDVVDVRDLVLTSKQGDIFAGTVIMHAAAARDSVLTPRPISSATRYTTESYIRGLRAVAAGEPLSDELWSFWPRVGLTLPYAVSLRAHVLDEAELDALGTLFVQDQAYVQSQLSTIWATPGTGPLGDDLRALYVAYDRLEDGRAQAGLDVGGVETEILADVVGHIYQETEDRAGDVAAREIHQMFLVRSLLTLINLPDAIYPLNPYPVFELRRQEGLLTTQTLAPVFAEFLEAFPCTGGGCPPVNVAAQGSAAFEALVYDPDSPLPVPSPDDVWNGIQNQADFQIGEYLNSAVGQTESNEFRLLLAEMYLTAGPVEMLDAALKALEGQPSVTPAEIVPPLENHRAFIEGEITGRFPTLSPEQQSALANLMFATTASQAALSDTIVFGIQ